MRRRRGIIRGNFSKLGLLCLALVLGMGSLTVGYPAWTDTLYIEGTVTTGEWDLGGDCEGTRGFWNNWDKHNTYTQGEIEGWLNTINGTSCWLVPDMDEDEDIDTDDMEAVFDAATGGGATMEEKFLCHYLATRLNAESGRLLLTINRDFSSYDTGDYLGLGEQGTLPEIIAAIESKCSTSPTDEQFELMKDICDALNNLEISPFPSP